MNTTIHFGNMPKSAFLKSYVKEQFKRLDRYRLKDAKADLWLQSEGNIENRGRPRFSIKIKLRKASKDLFIKKTKTDFFAGLQQALQALDKKIRRDK